MSDTSVAKKSDQEWPDGLSPYWIEDATVLSTDLAEEERPGRDSLGNAGRVRSHAQHGTMTVHWPRGRVVRHLEDAGLDTLRDTRAESELKRMRDDLAAADVDPFLMEDSLHVLVTGRQFPGQQRELLEAKATKLRAELEDPETDEARRTLVAGMLDAMDQGLRATVEVRATKRRFSPAVQVSEPCEQLGEIVPLSAGWRIVYRVRSIDPDTGKPELLEHEDDGVMVFHVVAVGEAEAVLLFTGGLHGLRHVAALEHSAIHDAWFVNRERARTDATAPWIGRGLYRDLMEHGEGQMIVHRRRDADPVTIQKTGEGTLTLLVGDDEVEVPVIHCSTSRDDELTILADETSPLVLRLREAGAELERTIEAVLGPLSAD
jgi:hypothetical protein